MREIKFRGKTNNGKWLYGNLIQCSSYVSIWSAEYVDYNPLERIGSAHCQNLVDDYTIGQYAELPDMKGKEIYEGDIVDAPYIDSIFRDIHPTARVRAEIKFINGAFVVEYSSDCRIYLQDLHDKIEVIGNIHDNPIFLKETEL